MSTFEQAVASVKRRPAPRTFKIRPEHFADTWGKPPSGPFDVGLRVPSEQAYRNAMGEADKAQADAVEKALKDPTIALAVREGHRDQLIELAVKAYNETLVTFCVARGICHVHDVTAPHPYFELADDEIPLALKSNAIRRIFDEIELLAVDQSPVFAEINDEETLQLAELLVIDDPFENVSPIVAARCKRYLKLVLDLLRNK